MSALDAPPAAQPVWDSSTPSDRRHYRFFRLRFTLAPGEQTGQLHLFADTRYRLLVNGVVIGHGPARFKASHPEYDSHDIGPHLLPGENVIAVIVCSFGWGTFFTDTSRGGLQAWGHCGQGDTRIRLDTPGAWKVSARTGRRSATPLGSFALGMIEDVVSAEEPVGWDRPGFDDGDWSPVVPHATSPWGQLTPRSIPLLRETRVLSPQTTTIRALQPDAWSTLSAWYQHSHDTRGAVTFGACLHTAQPLQVTLIASSPILRLNGNQRTAEDANEDAGSHRFTARLQAGCNHLQGELGITRGFAEWTLGWPADSAIEHRRSADGSLLVSGSCTTDDTPATAPVECHVAHRAIHVERGWRSIHPTPGYTAFPARPLRITQDTRLTMDFSCEVLGRARVRFHAAPGTVIIICGSERLNADGTVASGKQGTRLLQRLVARGGEQEWLTMHPLGFRYLDLTVLPGSAAFTLTDLSVVAFAPPFDETGRFRCSDSTLNAVWELCRETQVASLEDAYIDCPWRERGLYVGDQIIQYYLNLALFGDHTMMRRCIDLFLQGQDASGLVPPCSHRLTAPRHPDYAALVVESLWHHWARSGDVAYLRENTTTLNRLLAGLQALRDPQTGLVNGDGLQPYIDLSRCDRDGICFALNAFLCGAFRLAADLYGALHDTTSQTHWRERAADYAAILRDRFFDPERGLFRDRLSGEGDGRCSALGNTLALYYEIAAPVARAGILDFVATCAETNCEIENPVNSREFHFSSYSAFYALSVLYREGRNETAERFMRREWRRMLDGGAWTCWEYFVPSHSLCHAWSASPGWFMTSQVLGLRYATPGDPDRIIFDPCPGTLAWAEGTLPHPRGPIRARWTRSPEGLVTEVNAPPGVVIVQPAATRP